jgi:tRNA G46 methylase TrmB
MKVKIPLLQFLPIFKGKMRFGKFFYRKKIGTQSEQTFLLKENNLKITVPNLLENVSFELFLNGNYEKETIDFFINSIPQNAVLFDIGANIGAFSFTIAKQRPDVKIFAFEAVPFIFKYL